MAKEQFYEALTPFVSITLALPGSKLQVAALATNALESVAELAGVGGRDASIFDRRNAAARTDRTTGAAIRGFTYKRRATPGWTSDGAIEDIENHLVLAVALDNRLALHISDLRLRGRLRLNLSSDVHKDLPLSWLFGVPRAVMSAAFLEDGQARTLWLSGTHRRTALKADSKILSGVDLEYALDPFDDQSFFWSAARSNHAKLDAVIGVSPSSSRIWTRKAANFDDFVSMAARVLRRLGEVKQPTETTFRYLAAPLATIKHGAVHSAFDVSIMPPELSPEREADEPAEAHIASVVYETNLNVTGATSISPSFSVDAVQNGQSLGKLDVAITIEDGGKVHFAVDKLQPSAVNKAAFTIIAEQLKSGEHVNVRYDTGHSVSGRRVFALRNRRVRFDAYEPRDFAGFDIKKEKPSSLDQIGKEDSLFCWVQQNIGGWLACDDGSMEKADFIHIDDGGLRPVLSLIHVKGAHSAAPGRGVSVSAYEVVTAQAVKNLLWLDRADLAAGVKASIRDSNYFWHNHRKAKRVDFIGKLEGLPADYETCVVVLQPHVSSETLKRIRQRKPGADALRVDQLNTLLASAQRTCGAVGARFNVICAK
jgi:hypothetical protein